MSKTNKINIYIIFLGIIIGGIFFSTVAIQMSDFKANEFGLGLNTKSRIAIQDYFLINALLSETQLESIQNNFTRLHQKGNTIALWLGASQLHAINYLKEGDMLAVEYASLAAKKRRSKLRYLQVSQPNANFYELLCMFLLFTQKGLYPDWIIIAVTYDDLRETGIHEKLLMKLDKIHSETKLIGGKPIKNISKNYDEQQKTVIAETPQEKLENILNIWLPKIIPGYKYRGQLRSKIYTLLRGYLLHSMKKVMKVRRVPKIQEHLKNMNTEALWSLVTLARHHGCKVLIYKQPHAQYEGPFIHDRKAYDAYFEKLQNRIKELKYVYFLDLEKIVPPQYWGLTNDGFPDCYHFQDKGHQLLGNNIDEYMFRIENE